MILEILFCVLIEYKFISMLVFNKLHKGFKIQLTKHFSFNCFYSHIYESKKLEINFLYNLKSFTLFLLSKQYLVIMNKRFK